MRVCAHACVHTHDRVRARERDGGWGWGGSSQGLPNKTTPAWSLPGPKAGVLLSIVSSTG